MKVTPDVIRREFIGIEAKVAESQNSEQVGISGKIVDETRNMFLFSAEGARKAIPKSTSVFHFGFPDGTVIEIDGKLLVGRSEDRLKKSIRRLW